MLQQWLYKSDADTTGSDSIATIVRLHGSDLLVSNNRQLSPRFVSNASFG
jgi:hypothetical protein